MTNAELAKKVKELGDKLDKLETKLVDDDIYDRDTLKVLSETVDALAKDNETYGKLISELADEVVLVKELAVLVSASMGEMTADSARGAMNVNLGRMIQERLVFCPTPKEINDKVKE
jgi:hypothetical protein